MGLFSRDDRRNDAEWHTVQDLGKKAERAYKDMQKGGSQRAFDRAQIAYQDARHSYERKQN